MREIKLRVPKGSAKDIAELVKQAGIEQMSAHDVFIHGPNRVQEELKLKTSTPKAKKFLAILFDSPVYKAHRFNFSSHDIRSLVSDDPPEAVTCPAYIPFTDIQQDLWQYSHITLSFVTRVLVSAGLLAYALLKDDPVLSVGAMIFTPFSALILSIAFGMVAKAPKLICQGFKAFLTAFALTVGSAAGVTAIVGGPLLFNRFGSLQTNLIISIVMGSLAAVADADDVGRRQLIGLAMAYPFVKFPVWLGISLVLGFPDAQTTATRLTALVGNGLLMVLVAALTYWIMGRRGELRHLPQ